MPSMWWQFTHSLEWNWIAVSSFSIFSKAVLFSGTGMPCSTSNVGSTNTLFEPDVPLKIGSSFLAIIPKKLGIKPSINRALAITYLTEFFIIFHYWIPVEGYSSMSDGKIQCVLAAWMAMFLPTLMGYKMWFCFLNVSSFPLGSFREQLGANILAWCSLRIFELGKWLCGK